MFDFVIHVPPRISFLNRLNITDPFLRQARQHLSILLTPLDDDMISTALFRSGINYVTFEDYQNIDNEEMLRGRENKKPREKITSFNEMLKIAFRDKKSS